MIFRAYGKNYEALYVYDVASDALYFVADSRLMIHGKHVVSFETSRNPLVGNRLAMMLYFADGTAGEYLATLPKLPTQVVRGDHVAEMPR